MKIAILSHCLPPELSGQGMVLFRLLQNADTDSYCLISTQDYSETEQNLSGKYYTLPRMRRHPVLGKFVRTQIIKNIVRKEKCEAVVVCSGNAEFLPLANEICNKLKIPFYVYIFDDYFYQHIAVSKYATSCAQECEETVMKNADGIIVTNEYMKDVLNLRYDVESTIIYNSCDLSEYSDNTAKPVNDEKIILYTGSIYDAQANALSNLVSAIKHLKRSDIKLHLYTSCSKKDLDSYGISVPVVIHPTVSPYEVAEIQHSADILFLPLAFDSIYPELIKTTCPGKFGEYLASGRPVLANVPAGSFISYYISKYNCGVCVDKSDPVLLAEAINELLVNEEKRETVTKNAWIRANEDFNIEKSREIFDNILNWHPQRGAINDKW